MDDSDVAIVVDAVPDPRSPEARAAAAPVRAWRLTRRCGRPRPADPPATAHTLACRARPNRRCHLIRSASARAIDSPRPSRGQYTAVWSSSASCIVRDREAWREVGAATAAAHAVAGRHGGDANERAHSAARTGSGRCTGVTLSSERRDVSVVVWQPRSAVQQTSQGRAGAHGPPDIP